MLQLKWSELLGECYFQYKQMYHHLHGLEELEKEIS